MIWELPQPCLFEHYQRDFLLYGQVLQQQSKDSNKLYSLHEPQVYCVAKGKDHKQYEYGSKASIASHEQNMHDNHTLPAILHHVEASRGKACQAGSSV
nr:hypothetical protein [Nitrosomonas eutropha]